MAKWVVYIPLAYAVVMIMGSAQTAHSESALTEAGYINGTDASQNQLVEIVVTAEKRSERITDVPMSITAATGAELRNLGITDASQLSQIVPGFTYQATGYGTPIYTLRGIGFYDNTQGADPAVSTYVDQVPLPYSMMTRGATLDIDRVE